MNVMITLSVCESIPHPYAFMSLFLYHLFIEYLVIFVDWYMYFFND